MTDSISVEEYRKLMRQQGGRPAPVKNDKAQNRTEASYDAYLSGLRLAGEIVDYRFEPFNLRLAKKTYYRIDFLVVYPTHFEIHEVKGHWEDDARVKVKVAAELFPWFTFKAVKLVKKQWEYEEIRP